MSGINERRQGADVKLHMDSELKFKATALRNKLLAAWASELLGHDEVAAAAYKIEVIKSDFEEVGDDDVLRKVAADLVSTGTTAEQVREKMNALLLDARDQLKS